MGAIGGGGILNPNAAALLLLVLGASPATCQNQEGGAGLQFSSPSFFAVRVNDIDAASSWYQLTLGLDEVNRIEAEDGRYSIRILSGGGLDVELIQERGTERPADRHLGHFKAGLFVADIDTFRESLSGLGVDTDAQTFVDDILNARSFVFRDSEGNRIQAFQKCDGPCS